jgi:hypothetical protein
MSTKPLMVDWKGLLKWGHPFSRTHTFRKMEDTIQVSRKVKGEKRRVVQVIPNPDPFPRCTKLGWHPNSPVVWRATEVLAYYEAHGLHVTEDWNAL